MIFLKVKRELKNFDMNTMFKYPRLEKNTFQPLSTEIKMNKLKIEKQKRIASGLAWRFRAIELLTGGVRKDWGELTQDERVEWVHRWFDKVMEQQLEQQNG